MLSVDTCLQRPSARRDLRSHQGAPAQQLQCCAPRACPPHPLLKNRGVACGYFSSSSSSSQQCFTPVLCQAGLTQHHLSSGSYSHQFSSAFLSSHSQRAIIRAQRRSRAASAAAAAAGMLASECSNGGVPCSPPVQQLSRAPVGPQRAGTQRGSSAGTVSQPPAAAAAAAALAAPYVTLQQEKQQQQQTQQEASSLHASVWVPDKQLWMPHSPAAMESSSNNPLSSRRSGSEASLTRVFTASSATAGRKPRMEDRHVVAALDPRHGVASGQGAVTVREAVSLAAVFDGHAGDATATYAARQMPQLLHTALSGRHSQSEDGPAMPSHGLMTPRTAMERAFTTFDRWWADARCDPRFTKHGWDESGSTAVISMVSGSQLVVANAGDSVALMAHNGTSRRLTEEHRLDNEAEAARVREAGGRVVRTRPGGAARVMGTSTQTRYKGSMVTRSLGDFAFKSPQPLISAQPYVNTHLLQPTDKLVLLTSDGVTDVLPDDDMLEVGLRAIEQARNRTNNGNALAQAAAKAVMEAALSKGSTDNITVVAMLLDWGSQYEEDA